MTRLWESLLGGVVAAVITRSTIIAAFVVLVLYLAWENSHYGYHAQLRRKFKRDDDDEEEVN